MEEPIIVVGHKNPDNDSVCAAVGYAYLKNELARRQAGDGEKPREYVPACLGPLPPESTWVLEDNGLPSPRLIDDVRARVADVMTPDPVSVRHDAALLEAGRVLKSNGFNAVVVTDDDGTCRGLLTRQAIARRYLAAIAESRDGGVDRETVAAALADSLDQKVGELAQTDVLALDREALLADAAEDVMASPLREAVVLDDAGVAVGIVTRSDVAVRPKHKVVLVDHNEIRQAVDGIEEAEVVEIIDHHRIADVTTANPIRFLNLPVGSTATIVAQEFRRQDVDIPRSIAAALLSAILTDTVILKSPTTTAVDHEQVAFLSDIAGVDPVEFGLTVFRCRGGVEDLSIEELVGADSKEFQRGDATVLIAQRETVDLASVMKREGEIRAYLRRLVADHDYEFALLMATDIVAEGSQFICEGNCRVVSRIFDVDCSADGGVWMPGVLSRKKQVAAKVLEA